MAEFKHDLQECTNAILAFMVMIPLQFLIVAVVNSTIQIQVGLCIVGIVVVLLFVFFMCIFLLRCFVDKRHFKNKVFILFSLLVATIISILFTTFLALCAVLLLNINLNSSILNQICTLLKSVVYLIAIELFIYSIISFIGYVCIKKITLCKNEVNHRVDGDEYSAVLIGNNLSKDKNFFTNAGACGLYLLYRYFKNTNKKYEIRQKVDKSDFDDVVLDDDCQELYILGHGSKNSFKIKNGTNDINYSKYKGKIKHKKRVVAQLHCAGSKIGDESLVDILEADKNNSYVGRGYIFSLNIWCYCFKMWRKNRPKK
jgi:hypothetical protein